MADAGGVGEQVPDGDGVLAPGTELGDVRGDGVVEVEATALPLLGSGDRRDRFGCREPDHQGVGRHGYTGARLASGDVGDNAAVERHVELPADVESLVDASFEDSDDSRELVGHFPNLRFEVGREP